MSTPNCEYFDDHVLYTHYTTENPMPSKYTKHIHNEYEFIFFLQYEGEYIIENTIFSIKPNDFLIINPQSYHVLNLKGNNPLYERINISWDSALFDKFPADILFFDNCKFSTNGFPFFSNWVKRIEHCIFHYPQADKQFAVHTLICELVLYLKNDIHLPTLDNDNYLTHPLFNRAIEYINSNLQSINHTSSVAQALYISKTYLYYLFKKYLHTTPKKYITEKKMLQAEKLLHKGMSPTQIYSVLGFNDYSTFFRAFKKHFHKSPTKK